MNQGNSFSYLSQGLNAPLENQTLLALVSIIGLGFETVLANGGFPKFDPCLSSSIDLLFSDSLDNFSIHSFCTFTSSRVLFFLL